MVAQLNRRWNEGLIDPSHKSHNTTNRYPTIDWMPDFVWELCTCVDISVTEWHIMRHDTGALWDLCNRSIGPPRNYAMRMLIHALCQRYKPYRQSSNIIRIFVDNKIVNHSDIVGAALLQLHLHSRLNTRFQWNGRGELQDERRETFKHGDLVWRHVSFRISVSRMIILYTHLSCTFCALMMTSSNGNIFRVTGPLCGEFTGHWWIPLTKASDAELWCLLWSAPE